MTPYSLLSAMRRKSYINLAKKLRSPLSEGSQVAVKESFDKKDVSLLAKRDDESKSLHKATKQLRKMTNEELETLLTSEDDFVIDCLLDQVPVVKKLLREHDDLKRQITNLANYNYAREPEFVRDRLKLRDILDVVDALRRRVTSRHIQPILDRLNKAQSQLSDEARKAEEESEALAQDFLQASKSYDEFIKSYVDLRKEASRKRTLADKLAKEKDMLANNIPKPLEAQPSPIPTPRERKKANLNK